MLAHGALVLRAETFAQLVAASSLHQNPGRGAYDDQQHNHKGDTDIHTEAPFFGDESGNRVPSNRSNDNDGKLYAMRGTKKNQPHSRFFDPISDCRWS